jgi:hypothetical protein
MRTLLPMFDPIQEIKRLYFSTTKDTIDRDMARALELLRQMPSDEARERAAGYMHGLADLQREWKTAASRPGGNSVQKRKKRKPPKPPKPPAAE